MENAPFRPGAVRCDVLQIPNNSRILNFPALFRRKSGNHSSWPERVFALKYNGLAARFPCISDFVAKSEFLATFYRKSDFFTKSCKKCSNRMASPLSSGFVVPYSTSLERSVANPSRVKVASFLVQFRSCFDQCGLTLPLLHLDQVLRVSSS